MPIYFITFLALLGMAALLYVGALFIATFMRQPPPLLINGNTVHALKALHLAIAWANVGVGWLLYFNVYPIHADMAALGNTAFQAFARGYTTRLPIVVLPYGAGALAATLSLWAAEPGRLSRRARWGIASLWMLSIAATPWAAGAQGDMQDDGFSDAAFQQLQTSHLARSLCLTVAAVWALLQCRPSRD
ncbi:hypothetical protein SNE35_24515 [Paucibacter sp. R3-3]|uniref:DUF1772 domain-containing protein n=1 Tax=Roseateles agri TaxID=3098619 RepID=A0ABU5DQZ4_9BURK|nr:hypothetical protein [Paucibacter sp. R3-3]MDY0747689.1 hypothetical protein [Paucibacter sp. R3-3]